MMTVKPWIESVHLHPDVLKENAETDIFALDLGPLAAGLELSVQLLRWASGVPAVEEVGRVSSGSGGLRTRVSVDPEEPWLVLRVTDPGGRPEFGSPQGYADLGRSIAYTSPWWVGRG